jgi:hypothetical protein
MADDQVLWGLPIVVSDKLPKGTAMMGPLPEYLVLKIRTTEDLTELPLETITDILIAKHHVQFGDRVPVACHVEADGPNEYSVHVACWDPAAYAVIKCQELTK